MKQSHNTTLAVLISLVYLSCLVPWSLGGANSERAAIARYAPREQDAICQQAMADLYKRDYDAVVRLSGPLIQRPDLDNIVKTYLPPGVPQQTELVGAHSATFQSMEKGYTDYTLTYQLQFAGPRWVTLTFLNHQEHGTTRIRGLHIYQQPMSLEEAAKFSWNQAGPSHFLFCGMMLVVVVFANMAVWVCLLKDTPKKNLWTALTLLGVCGCSLNWATGQWDFQFLAFHVPPVAYYHSAFQPLTLQLFVPLGAMLFFVWPHRRDPAAAPSATTTDGIEADT